MSANPFWKSFQMRVTLALIISMFFIGALSNFLIYRFTLDTQLEDLRGKLKIIAQTAALMIDANTLLSVPLSKEGMNSLQYQIIAQKLKAVKEANPPVRFIYTLTKTEKEGIWQFIVDPEPSLTSQRREKATAFPGDRYDASRFPEMLKAFSGPSADRRPESDEWGLTLSGYAPIRNAVGQAVAVLGVDIMAPEVYAMQKNVHQRSALVLLLGIIFSLPLGMAVSHRISGPVKRLVEGTRRIAQGDLKYQVDISGKDEIAELARSFNYMAVSLRQSQEKLHSYFYDVIQSLIRIVEARDRYTRGHSERVAEYAAKIAGKMGFSADEIALLRETGMLHDIGKLGIEESVLNKREKLSQEEWEMIRQHPLIGEEILKPIYLNPQMLSIVREHHEHYDGKGYPRGLQGDEIGIFAQILSVADAYDAMTSSRAYREAFSKVAAIEELKRNKGTQFSPKIVEVFIRVLQEDSPII